MEQPLPLDQTEIILGLRWAEEAAIIGIHKMLETTRHNVQEKTHQHRGVQEKTPLPEQHLLAEIKTWGVLTQLETPQLKTPLAQVETLEAQVQSIEEVAFALAVAQPLDQVVAQVEVVEVKITKSNLK